MSDGKLNIPLNDSNSIEMSVQTYQAIHKMITGWADNITQYYRKPFEIDLNELVQLDKKIAQVCTQYKIISLNKTFTIYHRNDSKSELTSIELYDVSSNKPTESVLLKYNLLIEPQNVDCRIGVNLNPVQSYTISIRFDSEVALIEDIKDLQRNMPLPPQFFKSSSAKVQIDYVDYFIAKNMFNTIDEVVFK